SLQRTKRAAVGARSDLTSRKRFSTAITHGRISLPSTPRFKEKTGPLRARFESCRHDTDNHLPEGNSWLHRDRRLGGSATGCLQRKCSMSRAVHLNNADGRMSAMQPRNAA